MLSWPLYIGDLFGAISIIHESFEVILELPYSETWAESQFKNSRVWHYKGSLLIACKPILVLNKFACNMLSQNEELLLVFNPLFPIHVITIKVYLTCSGINQMFSLLLSIYLKIRNLIHFCLLGCKLAFLPRSKVNYAYESVRLWVITLCTGLSCIWNTSTNWH